MREIDRCLGLPLITLDAAEEMGRATHVVTDSVANRVIGFVASPAQGMGERRAFLYESVVNFGVDVLILDGGDSIRPLSQVPEMQPHLIAEQERLQRQAWTSDGERVGTLIDHAFDEGNAQIVSYRLLSDDGRETRIVPADGIISSSRGIALFCRGDLALSPSPSGEETSSGENSSGGGSESAEEDQSEPASISHTDDEEIEESEEESVYVGAEAVEASSIDEAVLEGAVSTAEEPTISAHEGMTTAEASSDAVEEAQFTATQAEEPTAEYRTEDEYDDQESEAERVPAGATQDTVYVSGYSNGNGDGNGHSHSQGSGNGNGHADGNVYADAEATANLSEPIRRFMPLLVGASVSRDVQDDSGEMLIAQGEAVTPRVVEAAWRTNRLYDLYIAAQTTVS